MSEQIKANEDFAELWRSGHQRRAADLGAWLREYFEWRRQRALEASTSYPEASASLVKKATV
jgi:hypothetical protein